MYILGLNSFGHDSSACLIEDGRIVSASCEDRFTRRKHYRSFPIHAIDYCLKKAKIRLSEIDFIAQFINPGIVLKDPIRRLRILEDYLFILPQCLLKMDSFGERIDSLKMEINLDGGKNRVKIYYINHHLAHAASCFFVSPFEEAAILTCDGVGERTTTLLGRGVGERIEVYKEVEFPHSLGEIYSAVTQFLGFRPMDGEGKVMGLASYGEPVYYDIFKDMVRCDSDGGYKVNESFFNYQYDLGGIKYSDRFITTFGPPRQPEGPIEERDENLAASLQKTLEEWILNLARFLKKKTGSKNLCLSGGVALNCVANGRILKESGFEEIFIQPASSDAGTSLGAAYYVYHALLGRPRHYVMKHDYLGPEFSKYEYKRYLRNSGLEFEHHPDIAKVAARFLAQGKIIGWFQGRMEFGPRALGNRSILADPRNPEMKDILNQRVKHREGFRPYAPSALEEKAGEYFDLNYPSPFMLLSCNVLSKKRELIPAVTHVDGTARLQTVSKETNPLYWQLIMEFERLTGLPVILNTSFNVRGEPIVCSPEDAINCFKNTEMDYLVLGEFLVRKKE